MSRGSGMYSADGSNSHDILFGSHQRSEPESVQLEDPQLNVTFWSTAPDVSFAEARKRGLLHRSGAPAVEWQYGSVEYWYEGKLHRPSADGPAVVLTGEFCESDEGQEEIAALAEILGEFVPYQQFSLYVENGKLHREDGPAYFDDEGLVEGYYRDGKLDRDPDEGPALTWLYWDGDRSYRYAIDGKLHREDGPALEQSNGHSDAGAWFKHGKLHRQDGPAIVVEAGCSLEAEEVESLTGLDHIKGPAQHYYTNGKLIKIENEDGVSVVSWGDWGDDDE